MTLSRSDRSLTAWVLYFCILFNVLACGIAHGQMSAMQLSGIGGLFCSQEGNAGPGFDGDFGNQSSGTQTISFNCPLCTATVLALALLFGLGWLRRPAGAPAPPREGRCKAPPRYSWPSANPRASP
jgi:hypothetical protein